jgi:hypothetical protein
MVRSWTCALTAVLPLCCCGCIPVAYVYPDVDVFSANLRDLGHADPTRASVNHTPGVITVEQKIKSDRSLPAPRFSKKHDVRLLETDATTLRHVSLGLAGRCELLCVTTFGSKRECDSHVKAYRRGYQTVTILPWKPLKHADWQPASTLEEQETAVDLLSDFQTDLSIPVPAPELADSENTNQKPWNSITTTVDQDTAILLAQEYAWLAALAQRAQMHAPHSAEIAAIHDRLRLKSQYWQERDANSPIVRPWESAPHPLPAPPNPGASPVRSSPSAPDGGR